MPDDSDYALGHERLDAYQRAIEFYALALGAIDRVMSERGNSAVIDQLKRASLSILLNIAEGAGKQNDGLDQKRYYDSARGSAMECGAIFDALRVANKLDQATHLRGKGLLVRIVSMLTKMSGPKQT